MSNRSVNGSFSRAVLILTSLVVPALAAAQTSPFLTGATALQTNILAWLTPIAIILVMALGAMAMANRMSWGWCIGAIIGIAIAFGAPQIVTWVAACSESNHMSTRNPGLIAEPLFVGATRPPMRWGVTYTALLSNLVFTMEVFLLSRNLLMLLICVPIHATCLLMCARDARYFDLLSLWLRMRLPTLLGNFGLWGAASYSPLMLPRRGFRAATRKLSALPRL